MSKLNTKILRNHKQATTKKSLSMLTCYDFQTAQMLSETELDLVLVGDSLGNVILGYDSTIAVTVNEMVIFASAVKRGAPNKFVVADLPFGSYADLSSGLKNSVTLFQKAGVEALKLEGAYPFILKLIERLTQIGIPVMGHIGLTPQSVHEQGGYYTHGKNSESKERLIKEAQALEKAGCFAIVLECIEANVTAEITKKLKIPTIGIGSGDKVDGQVLVINDLLHLGKNDPPKFCTPVANLFNEKKKLIQGWLK